MTLPLSDYSRQPWTDISCDVEDSVALFDHSAMELCHWSVGEQLPYQLLTYSATYTYIVYLTQRQ